MVFIIIEMSSLAAKEIAGIAVPIILGGLFGGLGAFWFEDMVQSEIRRKKWVLPLLGTLAGTGAGFMIVAKVRNGGFFQVKP